MDNQETLLDSLLGDFGVLHLLALGHLGAMAFEILFLDRFGHDIPFMRIRLSCGFAFYNQGLTSDHEDDTASDHGNTLVESALRIAERAAKGRFGHKPHPHLVRHKDCRGRASIKRLFELAYGPVHIEGAMHDVGEPQGQTIDEHGCALWRLGDGLRQFVRGLDSLPTGLTAGLVLFDARGHLRIMRLSRGDIDPRPREVGDEPFSETTFAGTGPAKDDGHPFVLRADQCCHLCVTGEGHSRIARKLPKRYQGSKP